MIKFKSVLVASSALFAFQVHAQEAPKQAGDEATSTTRADAPAKKQSFTTGVAKGRDLLDSAISASTLDETEIQKIGTRSSTEILGNIPGIRAETGGTDGLTAITIRGLPLAADGSKFLQIQEDGLPVMEFGDIHFAATTAFVRADLSLSQVQAIRGGSASTFSSNSPGGIVNFLSKTGEEEGGIIQLSSGIDHELGRADFNYGAHLSKSVRFNIGGYYRQGEGPRSVGYDAFRGGQVKFNITKTFGTGFVRLYAKFLDDREPNYGLVPIQLTGTNASPNYAALPGFDPRKDSLSGSRYRSSILSVDQNNNLRTIDLHEGNRSKVASLGLEAQFDVGAWTFSDRIRFARVSGAYNESLSAAVLPTSVFPIAFGGPGASLRYATGPDTGAAVPAAGMINGNGLMVNAIDINAKINSLNNFTNDFRGSRVWNVGDAKLTTTAGFYASSQDVDLYYDFSNTVYDVASGGNSRFVDVISANGTPVTQTGVLDYGIFGSSGYHRRYDLNYRVYAPYGSVNYQRGALALGASIRYDFGKVSGTLYGTDLGGNRTGLSAIDLNRDGTISGPERNVAILPLAQPGLADYDYGYASYSVGVNYRIAEPLSVFARYSRGARASADRLFFSPTVDSDSGKLTDSSAAYAPVKQAEGGVKFRRPGVTLFVTGFWASTSDKNLQIGADATGAVALITIDRTYSAKGVEVEGLFERGPMSLRVGATYTKAKIDSDKTDPTAVGNTPRHQPDLIFQAMPQYESRLFSIGTNVIGTTSSYAQDSNLLKQPGYVIVSPFIQIRPTDRIQLSVNAFNVFDKLGLVQVGSAGVPASGIVNAQTLNGRTITGSVRFNF